MSFYACMYDNIFVLHAIIHMITDASRCAAILAVPTLFKEKLEEIMEIGSQSIDTESVSIFSFIVL